jgi:hypothetical protein
LGGFWPRAVNEEYNDVTEQPPWERNLLMAAVDAEYCSGDASWSVARQQSNFIPRVGAYIQGSHGCGKVIFMRPWIFHLRKQTGKRENELMARGSTKELRLGINQHTRRSWYTIAMLLSHFTTATGRCVCH